MPILILRAVTPCLFKQLPTAPPRCSHTQTRLLHEAAATGAVRDQADLGRDVNKYAPPLRVRRHGFKSLPVSPLLREGNAKKPRKQTAQQHDTLKGFQKEVAMNPYGMHITCKHCTRKTLTPPCSTSSRNSHPNLYPHACALALSLPGSFHHNGRKTTAYHQFPDAKTEGPHTSWSAG